MVVRWGEGASAAEAGRRADEMLTLLGLAKKAHLRPAELSGGEKQRVAIGRALIKEPQFCFADEPTSALDWAHGEQVVELLRTAAHERNATVLIVAHDSRIIPYVDRVFYLADGRLRQGDDVGPRPHAPSGNGGSSRRRSAPLTADPDDEETHP
jgi:putative ABC transport system ATP-binding protein